MTTATNHKHSIESLVSAIDTLSLKEKQKLADILDQQIFEAKNEISAVKAAYEAGEYDTYENYVANRTS